MRRRKNRIVPDEIIVTSVGRPDPKLAVPATLRLIMPMIEGSMKQKRIAAKKKIPSPAVYDVAEAFGFDPSPEGRKKREAIHQARFYMWLYFKFKNGWFFWKAFQELRNASIPVPEEMLAMFDQIAEKLLNAAGQSKIVEAVELTAPGRRGGPQAGARAKQIIKDARIVLRVHDLYGGQDFGARRARHLGKTADAFLKIVCGKVARSTNREPGDVLKLYETWVKKDKSFTEVMTSLKFGTTK